MGYTVLARRYRSQKFDDVIGQDAIAKTLKNAIENDRVAHAYLFSGTRGVGKTTMARILAKSLNCLQSDSPTADPCLKCDSCISVNTGEDIDVIEIDGASNTGVDNIRQLRENALYRPTRARFKIYIIDEVHMLSTGAFNALLKILEEPPAHVKFIFATTEPNKVLPTIQSRCQRFDFSNISSAEIAAQLETILKNEKIKYEPDLIIRLSRLADGSMRDALSLLDQLISVDAKKLTLELLEQYLGQPNGEKIFALLSAIADQDPAATLVSIDSLIENGNGPSEIVDSLIERFRDLMVHKTAPKSGILALTAQEKKAVTELCSRFDTPAMIYAVTMLEKLRWTVKNSHTARALLEAALLRLSLSEHFLGIDSLISSLKNSPAGSAPASSSIKKKLNSPDSRPQSNPNPQTPRSPRASAPDRSHNSPPAQIEPVITGWINTESIISAWPRVINTLKQTSPGNASHLLAAVPRSYSDNFLTLAFKTTLARDMCSNRADQINDLLTQTLGTDIRIKIEPDIIEDSPKSPDNSDDQNVPIQEFRSPGARMNSEKRKKALDDPAVQILLRGLDAKTTSIEEID